MSVRKSNALNSIPISRCHNYSKKKVEERCRARCVLVNGIVKSLTGGPHNHPPHTDKIIKIQKRSEPMESPMEYWALENFSDVEIADDDILDSKDTFRYS